MSDKTQRRTGLGAPLLNAFDQWFASSAGVWQTLIVTVGVVAVELAKPQLDPHALILMAVLTVYSAVTQPALAHVGAESMKMLQRLLTDVHTVLVEVRELVGAGRTIDESDLASDLETNALVKRIAAKLEIDTADRSAP